MAGKQGMNTQGEENKRTSGGGGSYKNYCNVKSRVKEQPKGQMNTEMLEYT